MVNSEQNLALLTAFEHSPHGIFILAVTIAPLATIAAPAVIDFYPVAINPACRKLLNLVDTDFPAGVDLAQCFAGEVATATHFYSELCVTTKQSVFYRVSLPGEPTRKVLINLFPVVQADDTVTHLVGLCQDLDNHQLLRHEMQVLQSVTQAIATAHDFHLALSVTLRRICLTTGWVYAEAWTPDPDSTYLECDSAWYALGNECRPGTFAPFRQVSQQFKFAPGEGLPGCVWVTKQPVWIADLTQATDYFLRQDIASEMGFQAGLAVPIVTRGEVLAVLAFFMTEAQSEDRQLVRLVTAVAAQLGSVFQLKRAEVALGQSQQRLATLIDALPGIAFSCVNDGEWSMSYLSEGCFELTGYHSEELIGSQRLSSYNAITHPDDLPAVMGAIDRAIALREPYVVEYRIRACSGQEKWLWEKGRGIYDSQGNPTSLEGFITDITDLKQAERALRQAEQKYRSIFENAVEGIFQTTATGHYLTANPMLAKIYGYDSPAELMASLTDIRHQLYVDTNRREEFIRLLREQEAVWGFESQVYRKDGSIIWISENARAMWDEQGQLIGYEGTVEDITQRKQAEATIRYQAFHDLLTGLPNRVLFTDRLPLSLANARRDGSLLAVMFLDLDRFKTINDTLGHAIGDQLLQAVATRLSSCLRDGDTVSRWGGDEFTLLLTQIHAVEDAARVAQRLIEVLKPAFYLAGQELYISSSIGIALYPHDGTDAQTLLKNADAALYRVKEQGRNGYQLYTPAINSQASELLILENSLHHALDRQEFVLYYQPQVNVQTGQITRMEALLRWHHPELGSIPPRVFIPLAEENGLIVSIGEWVLRAACTQNQLWHAAELLPGRVAVNLSARQFQQPQLVATIARILSDTRLDPSLLELEITETTAMQNVEFTTLMLQDLHQMGIQISLDDFGTGYSSLSYLKKFPLDTLKIDQSFVRELTTDRNDAAIVAAVIALGQGLNLSVVAEGVETQAQMEYLRSLNCYEMQGYLFSKPLAAEDATRFLQKHRLKSLVTVVQDLPREIQSA